MFDIDPHGALDPVLNSARIATQESIGHDGCTTSGSGNWVIATLHNLPDL